MTSTTHHQATPARRAVAWCLWTTRRLHTTAMIIAAVVSLALAVGAVLVVSTTQNITPPPAAAPPTYNPSDLATGDPYKPRPPTAAPATIPAPTVGALPAPGVPAVDVAAGFLSVWLAGASEKHSTAAHTAWAATLAPYATPGLMAATNSTRLTDLPHAKPVSMVPAVLLGTTTVTATLDDGTIVVVELKVSGQAWRVTGVRSS